MDRSLHQAQFDAGRGVAPPPKTPCCAECGFEHASSKNFKKSGDDYVCRTGHYTDSATGELRRAKNPFAR